MDQTEVQQVQVWIKSEEDPKITKPYDIDFCLKSESTINNEVSISKTEPKLSDPDETVADISVLNLQNQEIHAAVKVYENGKKKRVQCSICANTFKNRANLKNHLKYVHSSTDDSVECKQCFKSFKTIAHLRSHTISVHADEKLVKCELCEKIFVNKKKLDNHIFYSHPKSNENVTCDICKKHFKQKYSLKVHMKQVHPAETCSVKCPHCDKQFKVMMLLQRHIKWSHSSDGMTYPCQECGRVLTSIAGYKKHLENVHSNEIHECDICFKSFKCRKTLIKHYKTIHKETKSGDDGNTGHLPCSECGVKFKTNTALSLHFEKVHIIENGNVCHICMQEFIAHGSLKRHLKTVHSVESATCHICEKTFRSQAHMQRHVRVTHAPPNAAQTCDICHKTFKCSMHLRIHINAVHSKEASFKCDICDKEFASKKYMLKHRKIHIDTKDFPCIVCGKYYKSITDVNKHMKRVHEKRRDKNSSLNHECDLCGVVCASNVTLFEHKKLCIGQESTLRHCPKCDFSSSNDFDLHNHILQCGSEIDIKTQVDN